jgi:hypothetical protein
MGPKHFYSITLHGKNHIRPTGYLLFKTRNRLIINTISGIFLAGTAGLPLYHAYLARLQALTTGPGK